MLRIVASLAGASAVIFGLAYAYGGLPLYMPILSVVVTLLLVAAGGYLGPRLQAPFIVQFLMAVCAGAFILLGVAAMVVGFDKLPDWMQGYWPPPDAAIVAVVVTALNYAMNFVPVIRRILDMVNPFFIEDSREKTFLGLFGTRQLQVGRTGCFLFAIILFLNIVQVYLTVLLSFWGNRFYSALQDKNYDSFVFEIKYFSILAAFWVIRGLAELYITYIFKINWRNWMTGRLVNGWLGNKTHYHLSMTKAGADNPDQRVSEDINQFIDGTNDNYVMIFVTSLSLYAFVRILWELSAKFPLPVSPEVVHMLQFSIGGYEFSLASGWLVWIAIAVSLIATVLTHVIGRRLVGLNFEKERVEANFRFRLMRIREYSEQIALLDGEETERSRLQTSFGGVIGNALALAMRQTVLRCFTLSYQQAMVVVPFVLIAGSYFSLAELKLGDMTQVRDAFGNVNDATSLFVTLYATLAAYKAVVNRLIGFEGAIGEAERTRREGIARAADGKAGHIDADGLTVTTPQGSILLNEATTHLREGERTLVTGPSGSGKTSFLRAISGIWPFGRGHIHTPAQDSILMLPQHAYMPLGTLRGALTYPREETAYGEAELRAALEAVDLGHLETRLDAEDNWNAVLSGGEKQRVSIARALLTKPDWLFLDEATSAVDEKMETSLYDTIRRLLPDTTIVSIGHRSSLAKLHDRRIAIVGEAGARQLEDAPLAAFS